MPTLHRGGESRTSRSRSGLGPLLILGAGQMQLPAFLAAREMGVEVVAVDPNPLAPARAVAATSYVRDLSDKEFCVEIGRLHRVRGVMTLCADYPMPTVAEVCDRLGLVGPSVAAVESATNKWASHRLFAAAGVPAPRTTCVSTPREARAAIASIGCATILKPARSSGGRGVTSLSPHPTEDEVEEAFRWAKAFSRGHEVVVSEYVDGPEYSIETLTWQGRTSVVAVTEKSTSGPPRHVEIGHSQPARVTERERDLLEALTVASLAALRIDDSPAHTEIRLGPNGPRVIEVGARLGGGFITTDLVPLSCGVDMVKASVQVALGANPDLPRRVESARGAAIRFLTPAAGRVVSIRGLEQAGRVVGVRVVEAGVALGDRVSPLRSAMDRTGYVISDGEDADAAILSAEAARGLIDVGTIEDCDEDL